MWEGLGNFVLGWIIAAMIQFATWIYQEKTKNATIVDIVWAATIALLAVFYSLQSQYAHPTQRVIAIALPCFWAFRLSFHLYMGRIYDTDKEDSRYAELRSRWRNDSSLNFFLLFQAQAFLSAALSIPFLAMLSRDRASLWMITIGLIIWMLALCGETLADHQLKEFKQKPRHKGKTCRSGLWKYSRHPNYFFEWLTWCSYIFFMASFARAGIALIAAGLMLFLLLKVTGIPPAEAQSLKKRGDEFKDYQKTTPVFFPWRFKIKPRQPKV